MRHLIVVLLLIPLLFSQSKRDPRAVALAGSYTTIANGIFSVGYNPGLIGLQHDNPLNIQAFQLDFGIVGNFFSIENIAKYSGDTLSTRDVNRFFNTLEQQDGLTFFMDTHMPIPLINSIASWLLKKRMHQIELFIKYPNEVQNDILLNLINSAKDTFIGKKYNFNSIKNYQTFSERVPVFSYEEFSDKIDLARKGKNNIFWSSKIKWFAKSSGTTNAKSKFIPVSDESLEDCHYAAGKDLLLSLIHI